MSQLFYRQESRGSTYITFFLLFFSLFYIWRTSFLQLNSPLYAKAFAILLHCTYWCFSHLSPPNTSCLPCEHLQFRALPAHECLLNCEQKIAQEECVVLNGKAELNVFNLEENEIIICQKLASWMLTAKYLRVSKRSTATQDSFSLKNIYTENCSVSFTRLLNQAGLISLCPTANISL